MTANEPTQANETNEKIKRTSRRNILKLVGTASAATLGAGTLTSTETASDATPKSPCIYDVYANPRRHVGSRRLWLTRVVVDNVDHSITNDRWIIGCGTL